MKGRPRKHIHQWAFKKPNAKPSYLHTGIRGATALTSRMPTQHFSTHTGFSMHMFPHVSPSGSLDHYDNQLTRKHYNGNLSFHHRFKNPVDCSVSMYSQVSSIEAIYLDVLGSIYHSQLLPMSHNMLGTLYVLCSCIPSELCPAIWETTIYKPGCLLCTVQQHNSSSNRPLSGQLQCLAFPRSPAASSANRDTDMWLWDHVNTEHCGVVVQHGGGGWTLGAFCSVLF